MCKAADDNTLHEYRDNDAFILYEKDDKLFMRVDNMEFIIEDTMNITDRLIFRDPALGEVVFMRSE